MAFVQKLLYVSFGCYGKLRRRNLLKIPLKVKVWLMDAASQYTRSYSALNMRTHEQV
jgi:hypothetical protein